MTQKVNLTKGGRVDLQKQVPALKKIRVELGWKENKFSTGGTYDLDVTAFVLKHDASGNAVCAGPQLMVFYNNLATPGNEIKHSGDNRTGSAADVDEALDVDVAGILAIADEVSFVITIHDAVAKKQNFGQIEQAFVRIINAEDNSAICEYDLDEGFSNETAVQVGSLYKNGEGHLAFRAVGQGFNAGLGDFCKGYGLNV